MNIWKRAIGIELTESELRIAVLRGVLGRFRLEKCFHIEGFSQLTEDQKREAVLKLVKGQKLRAFNVCLSLPQNTGIIRQLEFPVEVLPNLKSSLSLQLESLSPWPPEEVYWDFSTQPAKTGAKTMKVTVGMVSRILLDSWIGFFKSAALPLTSARLGPVTIAQGLAAMGKSLPAAVVIRCEPESREATLVRAERITSLQLSLTAAPSLESLLAKLASSSQLTEIPNIKRIVYGIETASGDTLTIPPVGIDKIQQASTYGFGAVAAALGEFAGSSSRLNLVPPSLRYRRSHLALIPTYALLALTALMGLAMAARGPYQTRLYAARLDSEINRLSPDVKRVLTQQTEIKTLEEKNTTLKSYVDSRDMNLEVLRELARLLPPDCWVQSYNYQDDTVMISGVAKSASEIQKLLSNSPFFREIQSTMAITLDPTGREHFGIRMKAEAPR